MGRVRPVPAGGPHQNGGGTVSGGADYVHGLRGPYHRAGRGADHCGPHGGEPGGVPARLRHLRRDVHAGERHDAAAYRYYFHAFISILTKKCQEF